MSEHLTRAGRRHLAPGSVVTTDAPATPYQAVIHAVAVDGFYDSSPALITGVVRSALSAAADRGARTVALAALATGYGRLTIAQFAEGLLPLLGGAYEPIRTVTIVVRGSADPEQIRRVAPAIDLI